MVRQLKNILGSAKQPIIINGKLLIHNGNLVLAYIEKYRAKFVVRSRGTDVTFDEEWFVEIFDEQRKAFNDKFSLGYSIEMDEVQVRVDSFTNAIVITTQTFRDLADPENHRTNIQFDEQQKNLLLKFCIQYTADWIVIYNRLLNRRLTVRGMSSMIRGHLVGSFFMPVIIGSHCIPSPFEFGEYGWLMSYLEDKLITLSHESDSGRRMTIKVIAMSDIAALFECKAIPDMSKSHLLLILATVAIGQISEDGVGVLRAVCGQLYNSVRHNKQSVQMFAAVIKKAQELTTSLAVRSV